MNDDGCSPCRRKALALGIGAALLGGALTIVIWTKVLHRG